MALGMLGIILPLLPTTPFLLLAAACYVRSSDRLYQKLVANRWLGPYIRNYREHRAITMRSKIMTLVILWGTITYTTLAFIDSMIICMGLLAIATGVTIYILRLRTLTQDMITKTPSTHD